MYIIHINLINLIIYINYYLQNKTATYSVSSIIFFNILEFTSSIRSGKSKASKLVKNSNTESSSIKSPKIISRGC